MSDSTPLITGTDFITVACKDFDGAVEFYGSVLGLSESKRWGQRPGVEFETGNLTIAVMQSEAFGQEFQANNSPIELRVEDFEAAKASWKPAASSSKATRSTRESAFRRSSRTRMATRSPSIIATRRRADAQPVGGGVTGVEGGAPFFSSVAM